MTGSNVGTRTGRFLVSGALVGASLGSRTRRLKSSRFPAFSISNNRSFAKVGGASTDGEAFLNISFSTAVLARTYTDSLRSRLLQSSFSASVVTTLGLLASSFTFLDLSGGVFGSVSVKTMWISALEAAHSIGGNAGCRRLSCCAFSVSYFSTSSCVLRPRPRHSCSL